MTYHKIWLHLTLLVALVLSLCLVTPAHAHGGLGNHRHGQVPLWMVELIYIQLVLIPVVGIWLLREAIAAWWPRRRTRNRNIKS